MDIVKRIRLSPAERRDQLLELGIKMLSLRGLEQISIEDIAKMAGISRGLLFHYFPSKRDFHLAIVQRSSDDILGALTPNEELTPPEMLRDVMERYVTYVTDNRDSYVSLLRGPGSGDPELRVILEDNRKQLVDRILIFGRFADIDITPRIELAVRGWIAFVEEVTISWLTEPKIAREELIDMLVGALPVTVPDAAPVVSL
ncbi:TetR/AcrR family transcriptional regulator [Antrihabitans sp. YC2-6]|uniref:TetR/AcrR family transcriptional regulator n=1 Tax=Antrihabitans sp. YC2-6 TaxID=2799498 RepID=UPI0018F36A15|nr:TetR/AcrR family transcriptional regulator [Antrihabitans sp. YC2-6]MBJ8343590.1 TetR/AcrR family transcriptional regulator [Antrihabitans sp. YC2-6]